MIVEALKGMKGGHLSKHCATKNGSPAVLQCHLCWSDAEERVGFRSLAKVRTRKGNGLEWGPPFETRDEECRASIEDSPTFIFIFTSTFFSTLTTLVSDWATP